MTTATDKIQYRIATKDMILGGEFVILKEGMLVKLEEKDNDTFVFVNHPRGYGGFSSEEEMKMYTRKAKKKDIKRIKKQFINEEEYTSLKGLQEQQQEICNIIEDSLSPRESLEALEELSNTEVNLLLEDLEVVLQNEINKAKYWLKDYVEYANMKPKELETDTVLYLY